MKIGTRRLLLAGISTAVLGTTVSGVANALPAFSRQTGDDCASCHVGGFGPQLTPHGMKFKMGGYTESDGKSHAPVSAMLVANYTHLSKDLPEEEIPKHFDENNNAAIQEVAGFLAGRIAEHVGSFAQLTYSDIDRKIALDNVDLRVAGQLNDSVSYGVSVNNNPGVQDPFNTLPVWRAPFTSSDLTMGPDNAPLLDDQLGGTVYGATAYAYTESGLYGEVGLYRSFGLGPIDTFNLEPGMEIKGSAPYARVAWLQDMHKSAFSVGVVAMSANLAEYNTSGPKDKFTDVGVDANYQYLGNRSNICTLDMAYIHEKRDINLVTDEDTGDTEKLSNTLNQFTMTASYYYAQTYGFTARYFNTTGSADDMLYDVTGKPDSSGYTLQWDVTPFGKESSWKAPNANVRVGVQYTAYNKVNGASKNYDGEGRDAADDNSVALFIWSSI